MTRLEPMAAFFLALAAAASAPAADSGPERDAAGRTIIRGPVYGGAYHHVRIISSSVGIVGNHISLSDSVIEAPVCISTPGMGNSIVNNTLICQLCVEVTGEMVMDNRLMDNQCAGTGTNRPDIFGW